MGAGAFLAGVGLAGFDPPALSPRTEVERAPSAMAFDMGRRQHVVRGVHPVDAAVAHALGVEAGALTSSTSIGQKLRASRGLTGPRGQAIARACVESALASLLTAGDVSLELVEVLTGPFGTAEVRITYKNLRNNTHSTVTG